MKELVSVIVPIYNVEEYLNQCVQSIRQQSYHNLEIILIDDGSPDKCGEMCDGYANEDSRVKVIHKQNGGLSDARNAGIEAATGEYITFIDSDDFIMQDMIECLMEVMNSENVDIVQCSFTRDADYAMVEKERDSDLREKYNIYSENRMVAYVKGQTIATMAWGKIYKTLLFREIRFPKGRIHEDVFTTYKLIHEANSIAVTDYIGYIYRINENGIMKSQFSLQKLDSIYGEIEFAKFIKMNYSTLIDDAYAGIIYACNQCLRQMARSGFSDEGKLKFLQGLYRKYGWYYIRKKYSNLGKIVTFLAMISINLAEMILGFLYRNQLIK